MVIALAGRRIDAENTKEPAFPLENAPQVRRLLRELFEKVEATALVCSGACGADLLALDIARELGLRSRIVLPYDAEQFRATSVTDRPGSWGSLYDGIVQDARKRNDLIELGLPAGSDETFVATNEAILDESLRLAGPGMRGIAVLVWEGTPRPGLDLTCNFAEAARERGLPVREILTLLSTI